MSGERHGSRLNDRALAEIDEDLRAALSVTPSVDFEARVLRRIRRLDERATETRRWWPAYALPAIAAVLIAIAVAVLLRRTGAEEPVQRPAIATGLSLPAPQPLSETVIAGHEVPVPRLPADPWSGVRNTPRAIQATTVRLPASKDPEVIVPREHAEAVRAFMRAFAEGRIQQVPEAGRMQPLIVEPIQIPAIRGLQ